MSKTQTLTQLATSALPYLPAAFKLGKEIYNSMDQKHSKSFGGPKPAHLKGVKYGPPLPPGVFGPRSMRRQNATRALRRSAPRRQRRQRRPAGVQQESGSMAPVSFPSTTCIMESDFKVKQITNLTHGPGIQCSFAVALTGLGTNGVVTTGSTGDYQNAISTLSNAGLFNSGFITVDGNWTSGFLEHPLGFGSRMNREANNWTEWQPVRLTYTYQNQVATSTTGAFTMGHTRVPDDFIESSGPQATPVHSYSNLSQNVPNCSANVYRDMQLDLRNWDRSKYYPTEIANTSPFASGQNLATLAYEATHFCGRFVCLYTGPAQVLANAGTLWLSGVINFFGPSASVNSIATTTLAPTLQKNTVYFRGKWRNWFYMHKVRQHLLKLEAKRHPPVLYEELVFEEDKEKEDKAKLKGVVPTTPQSEVEGCADHVPMEVDEDFPILRSLPISISRKRKTMG
jgi:hypothetical protein